jgi:hypothetical protein
MEETGWVACPLAIAARPATMLNKTKIVILPVFNGLV